MHCFTCNVYDRLVTFLVRLEWCLKKKISYWCLQLQVNLIGLSSNLPSKRSLWRKTGRERKAMSLSVENVLWRRANALNVNFVFFFFLGGGGCDPYQVVSYMYRIHLQFYCRRQIWEEKMGSFSLVAGWRSFRFLDPVDPINLKFINLK